jgi:hypothetical protein
MLSNLVQPPNATAPILTMPFGTITDINPVHSTKALSPISVMATLPIKDGITKSVIINFADDVSPVIFDPTRVNVCPALFSVDENMA